MTEPTRQEIIDAHEALEKLKDRALYAADFFGSVDACLLWKSEILKALPPKPQPTMADVEWDDDLHFLAEAKTKNGPLVAMIGKRQDQWITCIPIETYPSLLHMRTEFEGYLTPTGKRYTLTEVQE